MNANSSTTNQWLKKATSQLTAAHIETARLDALVLLSDVLDKDRTHLLAYPDLELTVEQEKSLQKLLNRRVTHEPLAYIRGKSEFYGREFIVDKHVIVPRPESESIIESLNEFGDIPTIIDVGTGSGALAISAQFSHPNALVYGVDIDPACIEVAQQNARKLGAKVIFKEGDLLRGIDINEYTSPVAILANLPYVPKVFAINDAAKHEPELALFGGDDGLDMYRVMFDQLREYDDIEIIVLTESLVSQHKTLASIAFDHGFVLNDTDGLAQTFTYLPK